MKAWQGILLGLACGLLSTGVILLLARPPRGQPVLDEVLPTHSPITVDVKGAVLNPGIYHLPSGSRVYDAVQAAGGLSEQANSESVNLAALLADGDAVQVASLGQLSSGSAGAPSSSQLGSAGPIDMNRASETELTELPGIGEVRAQAIITYRTEHGPFANVEDLLAVPGIGEGTLDKIRSMITVTSP
jgi:competence protein ComEA